jgi:hypothetical protein
MVQKFFW